MTARPDPPDDELERRLRASRGLADAPEHVIRRALDVFGVRSAAAPAPGLLQRLAAVLTFDSGSAGPLAFGMRSSGGAVRQLLLSVEGCDVDLRIAPGELPQSFAVSGQVLGPQALGVVVIQAEGGGLRHEAVLNELGEFRLPPVAAGRYRVTLELAGMAIDLPPLQIPQDT